MSVENKIIRHILASNPQNADVVEKHLDVAYKHFLNGDNKSANLALKKLNLSQRGGFRMPTEQYNPLPETRYHDKRNIIYGALPETGMTLEQREAAIRQQFQQLPLPPIVEPPPFVDKTTDPRFTRENAEGLLSESGFQPPILRLSGSPNDQNRNLVVSYRHPDGSIRHSIIYRTNDLKTNEVKYTFGREGDLIFDSISALLQDHRII